MENISKWLTQHKDILLQHKDILLYLIYVILVLIIYRLFIHFEMYNVPRSYYNDLNFEVGDIILYRWHYMDSGFRLFSKFSHVSMVVKDKKDDSLMSLEIHPEEYSQNDPTQIFREEGVNMFPLRQRLKEYDGSFFLLKMNKCNRLTEKKKKSIRKKIDSNYEDYKDIKFDTNFKNMFVWNTLLNALSLKISPKKTMFCSEFIGQLINDAGISKKKIEVLEILSPESFIHLDCYDSNYTKILI
jgi:hypothetical protein